MPLNLVKMAMFGFTINVKSKVLTFTLIFSEVKDNEWDCQRQTSYFDSFSQGSVEIRTYGGNLT